LVLSFASIFPTLMRANTNLPAAMVAERLAGVIGEMG
jgi:choline dehydrogenase-like flavoprotein